MYVVGRKLLKDSEIVRSICSVILVLYLITCAQTVVAQAFEVFGVQHFLYLGFSRLKAMVEVPRRPTMQEIQARRKSSTIENRLNKRLGMSLPNLGDDQTISFQRNSLLTRIMMSDSGEP